MPQTSSTGYLSSLQSLGDGLLASVQDRLKLFTIELQEEKLRFIQTFIWMSAVVFSGMMAVTFASLTLVYLFWESGRLAILGGLTALYVVVLGVLIAAFRRYLNRQPEPFADSLDEIGQDRDMYPQRELKQLAARKSVLRRSIAIHRLRCVKAAVRVGRPLAWVERVWKFGQRILPFAKVVSQLWIARQGDRK